MIPFDFDYYLPDTLEEAADVYNTLEKEGKKPFYYGGGTEILSMARVNNLRPDAVIDIKKIPECRAFGRDADRLFFGAAVTLTEIGESGLFLLLGLAGGRIADHTIQDKITLGGNLAGTIIYRETLLPLQLSDAAIRIDGPGGSREAPIQDILAGNKRLKPGELIVSVSVNAEFAAYPCAHIKKSKVEKIGYPLVSLCAINSGGVMRLAASGLCGYPFRFSDLDLSDGASETELAERLSADIPAAVLSDLSGSAGYRLFLFKKTAEKIIREFRQSEKGS